MRARESFLIVRRKKRRILLLDLNNLAKEPLTALRLQIDQFDARGNALGEKVVDLKKCTAKSGKFVLKKEIELHRSCIDFRVKILCANYGNYAYRLGDNDTYITYETPKKRAEANKRQIKEELGEKGFSAKSRKHRAPVFVGVFAAIVLVASGVLYSKKHGLYFMSSSHVNVPTSKGGIDHIMEVRTSKDLVNWSEPTHFMHEGKEFGNHYVAMVAEDNKNQPCEIDGDEFSILSNHNGTDVMRYKAKFTEK